METFKPYTTIEAAAALLPRIPENAHLIDRFGKRTITEALYAGHLLPALNSPLNAQYALTPKQLLQAMHQAMRIAGWRRETWRRRAIINTLGCTDDESFDLRFELPDGYR